MRAVRRPPLALRGGGAGAARAAGPSAAHRRFSDAAAAADARPLEGVRVLEMGQLIAGPFTGTVLAYFGAEVIKIEPPGGGDQLRRWRALDSDGTSYWTRSMMRNKKCLTLNMREERGRELAAELALKSDVLIENFRPGTMEKWGLGPERFEAEHPALIYTRISGYGQTGPHASRPGYASACEGFGGFRYIVSALRRPPHTSVP